MSPVTSSVVAECELKLDLKLTMEGDTPNFGLAFAVLQGRPKQAEAIHVKRVTKMYFFLTVRKQFTFKQVHVNNLKVSVHSSTPIMAMASVEL